jgi:4-amino-4-deoxy-L-arabinose transferase-like glycosyltransferase
MAIAWNETGDQVACLTQAARQRCERWQTQDSQACHCLSRGATVLLIGIALLVLPGPAFIVIPIGLAILATEYAWARRWLKKAREIAADVVSGEERKDAANSRV